MILSGQSILETPRWLRAVIAAAATFILPLGFTLAQDAGDLDRVQEWIDSGVNSAFLTEEQAEIMMRALRGANGSTEVNVVDDGRNVIVMKRKAMGDGDEVLLDVEYKGAAGGAPVAMAERQLAAQVAAGFISQGEADVVLDDLRNAIANGPSEGVRAFALRPVDGSFEVVTDRGNHSVSVDGDGAIESSAEVVYFDLKRVESDTAE